MKDIASSDVRAAWYDGWNDRLTDNDHANQHKWERFGDPYLMAYERGWWHKRLRSHR